jgi:pimeloyl-ACP methyl ester carboxylesterase
VRVVSCILLLISSAFADSRNQVFSDFTTPLPLHPGEILVLGIVGGWERWDAPHRAIRRTALELGSMRLPGTWVETVENHKLELAEELVKRAFDFDKSGRLDPAESAAAQIIVYGHSLGGSAALRLCRWLNEQGIRVRLAVVIDAYGHDPYTVPPNVAAAANLYQRDFGPVRGAPTIVAEDPRQTSIPGNCRYSYKGQNVAMPGEPFLRRWFMGSHLKMEYDPEPWKRVRDLLVSAVNNSGADVICSFAPVGSQTRTDPRKSGDLALLSAEVNGDS